jgi:hypothetical protein
MKKLLIALGLMLMTPLAAFAATEIPLKMNFQGTFSSGTITLDFYITSNTVSTSNYLWTESTTTTTTDGNVSYMLGTYNAISKGIFTGDNVTRYLAIAVNSGQPAYVQLVSIPYAYRASFANELAGGTTVQGSLTATNYYGDGSGLTNIIISSSVVTTDTNQLVSGVKTFTSSVTVTNDVQFGKYYPGPISNVKIYGPAKIYNWAGTPNNQLAHDPGSLFVDGILEVDGTIYGNTIYGKTTQNLSGPDLVTNNSNYLAKWTGVTTLSSSTVFDNGVSVGLGTTTPDPTAKIDVAGDIKISGAGRLLISPLFRIHISPRYLASSLVGALILRGPKRILY